MKIVILLLVMTLLACERQVNHQQIVGLEPDTSAIAIDCTDYANVITDMGVFNNNVWNKHAAPQDKWRQCIEKRVVNGKTQFGWSWSWPTDKYLIYAYPQVKVGASPWAPQPKFDTSFPLQISALNTLCSGTLNLAT